MLPYAIESLSLETTPGPLHRQLYEALRRAILDGRLAPETLLPATRRLARHLGVSRNTVVAAFDQLQAEGYVTAKVGHGTRVAAIAPENLTAGAPARRAVSETASGEPAPLSAENRRPVRAGPFEPGRPDIDAFPHRLWARLLARSARDAGCLSSPYEEPSGDPALRRAIARHVQEYRGVCCCPEHIVITTSAQAGISAVARLLLKPGDPVWLEEPGYFGALRAFREARAEIVPVPVDHDGLDPDAATDGRHPKLIYVTPSHQFPLGVTMPLARRLALLERAAHAGAYIVEDDYDSEFRFSGRPVAALQGLDQTGNVIYVGTFSKTLMPELRVGYLVLPRPLVKRFRGSVEPAALQPPACVQAALASFMTNGHYAAHIRRMRTIYARRLNALENAARGLPGGACLSHCSTGLQAPLYLGQDVDDQELAKRGRRNGLSLSALSRFYLENHSRRGLLLGFAALPEERIPVHMATLAGLMRKPLGTT